MMPIKAIGSWSYCRSSRVSLRTLIVISQEHHARSVVLQGTVVAEQEHPF